ncbi:MGMT family protein [Antarcticibacterium sp. 1MA-6-2]|uniref:MGMT family protein n=1 Tax=Antarcticibacterium sp. 1MA-6-2 TaxID=2908210 RepID=UPI001F258B86|nr:MGMT family protein [Antarcticibacterium sp. 1MA-6-2]UJH90537.1 MGMT family protein [Antarcticibacterium sp. 1MA-6-2]
MEQKENFFEKVYEVVKKIPAGRVTSYGAIARYLGSTGSSRMVGWALNNSHRIESVPAQRVVNRFGMLTGKHHFGGTTAMQQMLESEGVEIRENQVQDFEKIFWDPSIELGREEDLLQ